MILSVLIPSLKERESSFNLIVDRLNGLIKKDNFEDKVEIIPLIDNREKTTGEKRNILKDKANGKYICFVDDDDDVSDDYFTEILKAIEFSGADIITFHLNKYIDGQFEYQCLFSKFMAQGYLENYIIMLPFHLCPHKKELADKINFPHKCFMEDSEYAVDLDKITKTEFHIQKVLYVYNFKTGKY